MAKRLAYQNRWSKWAEEGSELHLLETRKEVREIILVGSDGHKLTIPLVSALHEREPLPLFDRPREQPQSEPGTEEGYVIWHYGNRRATLTQGQAAVLDLLVRAVREGIQEISQDVLITASGKKVLRLVDIFRRSESWEWIRQTRTGYYAWAG